MRGYNVMKGYIHDPEGTAEAIDADGWLHTGDVGTLDERGNLTITGRKKEMFIVGGFNAYPAEIEDMILEHPGVSQVAVVEVPDTRMGEVGYAFVVGRAGAELDADGLIAWCKPRMANYKVPRFVEILDELPAQRDRQGREVRAPRARARPRYTRTGRRGVNVTVAPVLILASPISGASLAGSASGRSPLRRRSAPILAPEPRGMRHAGSPPARSRRARDQRPHPSARTT